MTNLLGQLTRWRRVEQLIRLAWGGARWVAIVGVVLAGACLVDWLADRYLGSESFRKFRTATWVFAPRSTAPEDWSPDAIVDETPFWLRFLMTSGQLLLATGLAYLLLVRPWRRTPPVDELAGTAEKAIREFDHRLVTAVQLNRPEARTLGMSKVLIAEVTREAGELASRHNLLRLIDYRRLPLAALVAVPVLLAWGGFVLAKTELATVLLKRQLLLSVEIPRTIHLTNVSQEVWPTGSRTEVRYLVTGEFDKNMVGRVRIEPEARYRLSAPALTDLQKKVPEAVGKKLDSLKDKELTQAEFKNETAKILGREEAAQFQDTIWDKVEFVYQPEFYVDLKYDRDIADGALFVASLPESTSDFSFSARLGNGRSRERGRIRFEPPPQAVELESWQLLPKFLGTRPDGQPYERQTEGAKRGEVVDALPMSSVRIGAVFSKPVKTAILTRIERGVADKDRLKVAPLAMSDDRTAAEWRFPTTERTIAYEINLVDDRGFTNAVPIQRNIRMLDDKPPVVSFMPESDRHPDPNDFYGKGDPKSYEWGDKMPLAAGGRVMVIYHARSEQGVSRANIRYRVIPKGVNTSAYPKEVQEIQHPSQDPEAKVFARLPLKPVTADLKTVGNYVLDLGLFEKSWQGLGEDARDRVNIEFYSFPGPNPAADPPGLEAGGRYNFEIDGLLKTLPDGSTAKLELGDAVELYVEVFDKNPGANRAPGYTKEARRKLVVTPEEAVYTLQMRDEQNRRLQNKITELVKDQGNVFKGPNAPPKK